MDLTFTPYVFAAGIYLVALIILVFRQRTYVTPFHFCLFIFFAETLLAAFPHLKVDSYGRTHYEDPLPATVTILIGSGLTLGLISVLIRRPRSYQLTDFTIRPLLSRNLWIAALLGIVLTSSVISVAKLKTFPLLAMANFDPSEGNVYEFAFSGFLTYIGWGAARTLALWMFLEMATTPLKLSVFVAKNLYFSGAAALAMLLNVLDGQRNGLVLMGLNGIFLASLRGWVKWRHVAICAIIGGTYFVVAGNFRSGTNDVSTSLSDPTEIPAVDSTLAWTFKYLEPNIHNLNNLVEINPPPAYGVQYLSDIVPDSFITPFMEIPESSVEMLAQTKRFAQPGLTFRTAYADFYRDFGAIGCICAVSVMFLIGVVAFNHACQSPRALLIYLMVAPGIVFMPFMNILKGIPAILPGLLLFILTFQRKTGGRERRREEPALQGISGGILVAPRPVEPGKRKVVSILRARDE